MKYKHIIFDLDGTLLNSESAILCSLIETLKEVKGVEYEAEDLKFVLGIPGDTALESLEIKDIEGARSIWHDKFQTHYAKISLFPGIEDLLLTLVKKGLKIGVITSKTRAEYNEEFLPHAISNHIHLSLCIDDYKIAKPAADGLYLYLKISRLHSQDVLYIGDTVYDFECARGADVNFGLAAWGCNNFKGIHAKYFFSTPMDVTYQLGHQIRRADPLVKLAQELQFIGQVGETYTKDLFDLERYKRIRKISADILAQRTTIPLEKIEDLFCNETGFQTPKLDVRAAIVKGEKILLVKERNDTWALPGGWVDVNDSIKKGIQKEVLEEAGLHVAPIRLIALQDRNLHNRPAYAYGIIKVFVLCMPIAGHFRENNETTRSDYFPIDNLPILAHEKTSFEQIKMCLKAAVDSSWKTIFD